MPSVSPDCVVWMGLAQMVYGTGQSGYGLEGAVCGVQCSLLLAVAAKVLTVVLMMAPGLTGLPAPLQVRVCQRVCASRSTGM
jgi:hypothetical protein